MPNSWNNRHLPNPLTSAGLEIIFILHIQKERSVLMKNYVKLYQVK